jgi:phosphate transport system substrate-binding protein
VGDLVQWPGGTAVRGNDGVARAISLTNDAIGYVEYDYAMQSMRDITFGCVENKRQECITPDFGTVARANCPETKTDPVELQECVVNSPNEGAYPIAAFTWLLVPVHIAAANKRAAVKDFLGWMLTDGQGFATNYGFAPLPEEIAARQRESIAQVGP